MLGQSELLADFDRRRRGLAPRQPFQPREELQMLAHGQRLERPGFLRRDAHQALRALRLADDVDAEHADVAARRPQLGRELPEKRRLARPVGAEHGDDLAAAHLEIDATVGAGAVPVFLDQTAHADGLAGRRHGGSLGWNQFSCRKSTAERIASSGLFLYAETS